ncbi:MAG: hypothetical protein JXB36_19975 [Gammaproteobacteria bacterium]|nr:hypothetical protein [Gammaproteobacteria bacterium]
MSRALLVCHRRAADAECTEHRIARLAERLTPDNLVPALPQIARRDGVVAAVFEPSPATAVHEVSIRLGATTGAGSLWWKPGAKAPDGCFALLRADEDRVELVADATASRTLWYVLTDDLFVASSSQRAIVALLGSFEPNHDAAAWMLSSATLGPGNAWDLRLAPVPPGGRVTLDRRSWRLRAAADSAPLAPQDLAPDEHRRRLEQAVEAAVGSFEHEPAMWLLPLSGGIDSRGLLLAHLRAGVPADRLRCVTWGRRAALEEPGTDAYVARALAERFGVEHRYFETDVSDEDRDVLIDRFLVAGEGRIGHISGYLDGFELWRRFRAEGVHGVIRGDHSFGGAPVRTPEAVMQNAGLLTLEDHFPGDARTWFDLPRQTLPAEFARGASESLDDWRDRLRQQFRLPAVMAALTDLKTPYVEVVNPLLCEPVAECNRHLPVELRTGKRLWKEIVNAWAPGVTPARRPATLPVQGFLDDDDMLERMMDELASGDALDALGPGTSRSLRASVYDRLERRRASSSKPARAVGAAARKLRSVARKLRHRPPQIDPVVVAFRGIIVTRMNAMLEKDAAAFADAAHS